MAKHHNVAGRRILYVAYPLLTVSEESAGGAEQILWTLEREVRRQGAETTVAASSGSSVAGELFATGDPCRQLDDFDRRNREHHQRIAELVRERDRQGRPFHLVHDMSGSLLEQAAEIEPPLLATLHLPRHFYQAPSFEQAADNVVFNFVSHAQASAFAQLGLEGGEVIGNGIVLDHFHPNIKDARKGLLWLGRICEEKAPHLAIEIARQTSLPITLAGQVYPFSYHQSYFAHEVAPLLDVVPGANFVASPSHHEKSSLLRQAQVLLLTSQVDETSSLVAMEAAASGTPVIAFRRGALAEVVRDGLTGFLVDGVDEAAAALRRVKEIQPEACVRHARENFSSQAMTDKYLRLYSRISRGHDEATIGPLSTPRPAALG